GDHHRPNQAGGGDFAAEQKRHRQGNENADGAEGGGKGGDDGHQETHQQRDPQRGAQIVDVLPQPGNGAGALHYADIGQHPTDDNDHPPGHFGEAPLALAAGQEQQQHQAYGQGGDTDMNVQHHRDNQQQDAHQGGDLAGLELFRASHVGAWQVDVDGFLAHQFDPAKEHKNNGRQQDMGQQHLGVEQVRGGGEA